MNDQTIFIKNFNQYTDKNLGTFWSYIYQMLKFAYPDATFVFTIDDLSKMQNKDLLLAIAKPANLESMMPLFSEWKRVICWSFEAINTTEAIDNTTLLANRRSLEKVNKSYQVCHIDEESAKQIGCTWLPIGYSPILESKKIRKNNKVIFVGDYDTKNLYRYNIIKDSCAKAMGNGFGTSQQTNDIIAKFEFGLHVPSTTQYLNVNWHRLMLYYANKTIPVLIGPKEMHTPRLPFIRLYENDAGLVKYLEYDSSFANRAYNEVRSNYDFRQLLDKVLYV